MIATVLALALAAPPALRLADLLREAHEKNPDLQAAQARVSAARSSISPAGALDDPTLMVQLWNTPVDFSNVPVMVQVTQQIPLGGKRGARTDVARADAAMAAADLAAKRPQRASPGFRGARFDRQSRAGRALAGARSPDPAPVGSRDGRGPPPVGVGAACGAARPRSDVAQRQHHRAAHAAFAARRRDAARTSSARAARAARRASASSGRAGTGAPCQGGRSSGPGPLRRGDAHFPQSNGRVEFPLRGFPDQPAHLQRRQEPASHRQRRRAGRVGARGRARVAQSHRFGDRRDVHARSG